MTDDISKDKDQNAPEASKAPKQSNKPAKKPASSGAKKTVAKPVPANVTNELGLPQKVDFMWTVAFVVVAFVLGFFIRGLFLPADSGSAISTTNSISGDVSGSGANGAAPALTEDQLNSQLPTGHPNINNTSPQTSTPPAASSSGASGALGNVKSDVPATGGLDPTGQSVEVTDPAKK
ncbi:MAG: hypothetical protein ACYC56_13150 [Candidatus Aquicultor sp.]